MSAEEANALMDGSESWTHSAEDVATSITVSAAAAEDTGEGTVTTTAAATEGTSETAIITTAAAAEGTGETVSMEEPVPDKEDPLRKKDDASTPADIVVTEQEEDEKELMQCTPPPPHAPVPAALPSNCKTSPSSSPSLHHFFSSPPAVREELCPTLEFLLEAHKHLGRMGWCCKQGGVFLAQCVQALRKELAILTRLPPKQREVREGRGTNS